MIQLPRYYRGQAFPGALIDHVQYSKGSSIMGPLNREVIAPDVVGKCWLQTQAVAIVQPHAAPLGLISRDFQPFLSPQAFDPFIVLARAFRLQQSREAQ